jgi:folate-binding protein YgfZ
MMSGYPAVISSFEQELQAHPSPGIFFRKWELAVFEITGADRLKFLHNIASQDFKNIQSGVRTRSSFLNNTGRMIAVADFFNTADKTVVVLDQNFYVALAAHLDKYIIMEDVQIGPVLENLKVVAVCGEQLESKLETLIPNLNQINQPLSFSHTSLQNQSVLMWHAPRFGTSEYCFIMDEATEDIFTEELKKLNLIPSGSEAVLALEILHGQSRMGLDYTPDNLPLEVGEKSSISFNKGCYLGQEIIARIDSRGHVAKGLAHIEWQKPLPILAGQEILEAGQNQPAGVVTRSMANAQHTYSIAFLKYEYLKTNQEVLARLGDELVAGKVLRVI